MNELATVDKQTGEIAEIRQSEVEIVHKIKAFMDAKEKKIMFNGKRYAEYEDWQYAAGFLNLKVKTFDPQFVEINGTKGFKAKAVVVDSESKEVGSAESFCMMDEPNWKNKPLFQLSSMAQTRAGAKALSNIFRPLMRMAGIEGTPSEEMTAEVRPSVQMPKEKEAAPKIEAPVVEASAIEFGAPPTPQQLDEKVISEKQRKLLFAKWKSKNIHEDVVKAKMVMDFGKSHSKDLVPEELNKLLKWIDGMK